MAHFKMNNKKSQSLPLNIIIIAAILLIVLIVLVSIFSGYIGNWTKNFAGTCQEQGGQCSSMGECKNKDFPRMVFAKGCQYYERDSSGKYKPKGDINDKAGQCCLPLI